MPRSFDVLFLPPMSTPSSPENLHRAIGPRQLAMAIINSVVGSGIFVLPAIMGASLGGAAVVAYLVCGGLIFLIGLCLAEVGSRITVSGGAYAYIEKAFGPYAGFLANNICWLGGSVVADAAISNALVGTLAQFFPVFNAGPYRVAFLLLLFGGLAWLNIGGVKKGVRFIEFATLGKLVPLIVLVVVASRSVDPAHLAWTIAPTASNVGAASLLLFYAFLGMDTPLTAGGEIKDPRRTVPLALFLGVGAILVLYIAIQFVAQGVLGDQLAARTAAPLGAVAGVVFGPAGVVLLVLVTAVSMLGTMAGNILATPRMLYSGARNGTMPKPMARVHPRFLTPHVAIIVYVCVGCALAITGEFKQLAIISSASVLLVYLGVVLSTLKLRRSEDPAEDSGFRAPGGAVVPLLAAAAIVWLLSNLEQKELTGMAVFLLLLSGVYWLSVIWKRRRAADAMVVLVDPAS